ncbi:MAG: hypothetical protein LLG93_19060 [Deltaproteobacteria bacterium]|nr:hypothetical protein [Deltaproteobacteria bacterium]
MAGYEVGGYRFDLNRFFPRGLFDSVSEVRVADPGIILAEAKSRKRRRKLTKDGKLVILAADHPGRMITKSEDDPIAMGDRHEYLGRVLRVVTDPAVDGIMATTDIIEDLFIVNHLVKKGGGPSFLDEKVMMGSMNRGGLSGALFEMDDTFTCFSVESIRLLNLDAAKMMFRLDVTSREAGRTMLACAQAINELNRHEIPIFLEPLYVLSEGYKMQKTVFEMVKIIGVASAMGDSTRNLWLKIPYGENYGRIVKATTLPLLMLGGESKGDPTGAIGEFVEGMRAGANVRGALVGRNVLFPGKDDPLAAALAVDKVIHSGYTKERAVEFLMASRDLNLDTLTRYIR